MSDRVSRRQPPHDIHLSPCIAIAPQPFLSLTPNNSSSSCFLRNLLLDAAAATADQQTVVVVVVVVTRHIGYMGSAVRSVDQNGGGWYAFGSAPLLCLREMGVCVAETNSTFSSFMLLLFLFCCSFFVQTWYVQLVLV